MGRTHRDTQTSGYDADVASAQDTTGGSELTVLRKPYKQTELGCALEEVLRELTARYLSLRKRENILDSFRKLGDHHLPAVEPTAVDDESSVANRVNSAPLLARGVHMGRYCLQHDNVVLVD